jgi:hypothetical protein
MAPDNIDARSRLRQVLSQIRVMESHAVNQGIAVPDQTATALGRLAELTSEPLDEEPAPGEGPATGSEGLSHARPRRLLEATQLAYRLHGQLAALVRPATPGSIEASKPRVGMLRLTSPRLSDALLAITIFALAIYVAGTYFKASNTLLPVALRDQLFHVGAALLGASFSGLYTAYKYLTARTFDPQYNATYYLRLALGTVSGVILANIGTSLFQSQSMSVQIAAPSALALVGGYSAEAVNLILQRVADTLVAAVRGAGDEALKARQAQVQADVKGARVEDRQATTAELAELLARTTDVDAKDGIQRLMIALGKGQDVTGVVSARHPTS